ncbi:thiamine ABC transporter substrate-binding protein [Nocardioides gansuensis]|uniref:Thiamine ABC transporter substrate-binding protein n=1 Tax=Nocardioides gansuensis TaxID=2138300 RepID=A0A2T8F9U7_9ACTN|nr:thiamine ABC transporter substrate-binding protein [Nocardioides gansuensis]PVG82447.1 thiamine ABC transporter substrate-binding protein [Nocardioides gansuensis]
MTTRLRARMFAATALLVTGCSTMGGETAEAPEPSPSTPGAAEEAGGEVVLVTHESFHLPEKLVKAFESESGYDLTTRAAGDAGTLAAKLSLTADNPTGDVAFGIDNTFASRPLDEDVFDAFSPTLPEGAEDHVLEEGADRLTPIDTGSVCVNIDRTWFEEEGLEPPRTLDDLVDPAYKGLFVTPGAPTSSPGMAFLLATVAEYGEDGWHDYWADLIANDVKIVDGWEDAYYGDFTQGGGKGTRPIVLSYDSSPAFTVPEGADESTTEALLDTCFRQVEYAGVLAGADNPVGGQAVIEWLLTDEVQSALPTSMYVFPVSATATIPDDWAKHAEQPTEPLEVSPEDIAAHREEWLTEWQDITTR